MTISPTDTTRNLGLDVVRSIAILLVMGCHYGNTFLFWLGVQDPQRYGAAPGFYGVELFFVLSGFLIGRILLNIATTRPTGEQLLVFLTRRWCTYAAAVHFVGWHTLGLRSIHPRFDRLHCALCHADAKLLLADAERQLFSRIVVFDCRGMVLSVFCQSDGSICRVSTASCGHLDSHRNLPGGSHHPSVSRPGVWPSCG